MNPSHTASLTASPNAPRKARHTGASRADDWLHALIWVLLAAAALLLIGFTAVVSDITERGELRHQQQRNSCSMLLPDELAARGMDVARLLSLIGDKLAER